MALNPRITSWTGQVVWLVGASTGIGLATAKRLHAAGATVVVSARSADALDDFVAGHPGSIAIALDATDRDAVRDAAATIVERCSRIDLAVYCAGYYKSMQATDFDLDDALRHQQVNVVGVLVLLAAVLPTLLRQQSGHISLVSSVSGFRGLPRALAYGPTKAALINLAESMWFDLNKRGIGVSVVCPGFVDTPLSEQIDHPRPALISADEAAGHMIDGWQSGQFLMHFPKRFTTWLRLGTHLSQGLYFRAIRRVTGM